MAKLGFKRLSRGVKLLTDHIHAQIQSALTLVTSTKVPQENLENGFGVTRLSFSWPVVNISPHLASALFCLTPPQELFRSSGVLDPDDPNYILDSISFAIDTRDEAAAITSYSDPLGEGALSFADANKVSYKLSIFEKKMTHFDGDTNFDNTVLTIDYPNLGFNNTQTRTSPQVRSDLGISLNPYNSYCLVVDCSALTGSLQTNSLNVTLTIKSNLLARDSGSTAVQNIPQSIELSGAEQYGGPYVSAETLTVPAAGSVIKAKTDHLDTGVQGSIEKIDAAVRSGLSGGYNRKSRRFGYETLATDSAYQVIAVPMWGNGWYVGKAKYDTALLPYMGASPYSDPVVDRRIIPIHHSMTVHHVHCFLNYSGLNKPTTSTYEYDIGVGIGCGLQSDTHSYRQLARLNFNKSTKDLYMIDDFLGGGGLGLGSGLKGSLMNVPLVGANGVGYDSPSGKPFYVGLSDSPEETRSSAAEAVGGADVTISSIDGKEQWIEVRMLFKDTAGIDNMPTDEGLVGLGGHWVYIIGKRHVC